MGYRRGTGDGDAHGGRRHGETTVFREEALFLVR